MPRGRPVARVTKINKTEKRPYFPLSLELGEWYVQKQLSFSEIHCLSKGQGRSTVLQVSQEGKQELSKQKDTCGGNGASYSNFAFCPLGFQGPWRAWRREWTDQTYPFTMNALPALPVSSELQTHLRTVGRTKKIKAKMGPLRSK